MKVLNYTAKCSLPWYFLLVLSSIWIFSATGRADAPGVTVTVIRKAPIETISADGVVTSVKESTIGAKFTLVSSAGSRLLLMDVQGIHYRIAVGATDYVPPPPLANASPAAIPTVAPAPNNALTKSPKPTGSSVASLGQQQKDSPDQPPPNEALAEIQKAVGFHVVSLAQQEDGPIWIGTEGEGVFRYDEQALPGHQSTRFNLADNDIYALCVDQQHRVWAGHLNHGVSVFNGDKWQNYDVLQGAIGERIYAMTCSPKDGSVWMATSAGISRYLPDSDSWQSFTTEDGLPENMAICLACDGNTGDIIVGFKTKGVAMARSIENFSKWYGAPFSRELTKTSHGDGLPTGMINDVLVTKAGVFYAATTQGLAWSTNHGLNWKYLRGADWTAKLDQLANPPSAFNLPPELMSDPVIPQDYIASLAELPNGKLALGLWGKGLAFFDLKTLAVTPQPLLTIDNRNFDCVNRLLTLSDGRLLRSGYAAGVYVEAANSLRTAGGNSPATVPKLGPIPLPSPATTPDLQSITALRDHLIKEVRALNPNVPKPKAVLLSEDWRTQGKFLGRYGKYWACLCSMLSPDNYIWGAGDQKVSYFAEVSKHHKPKDSLRYYISWLATNRPGSLEMPLPYLQGRLWLGETDAQRDRRQSEWDDHGEAYLQSFDGPHVRCNITIPPGHFILSYYNVNKDGQWELNRFRDYYVTLREHKGALEDVDSDFDTEPIISDTRTTQFTGGGVFSSWLVQGPCTLTLEVNRNYSFNTIIAGLFLDQLDELPAPYLEKWEDYRDPAKP